MINAYAVFEAGGELKPHEYDPGDLGNNEAEIDVLFSGVCHSDLSMIDNEWGIAQYPLVPGHEVVGRVAQVGSGVRGLAIGQVVGLGWHSSYCNACAQCDTGDHNLCSSAQQTIIGREGGFADKVRADANSLVPVPEGMDLQSAGPLFCAGITVFNPLLQLDIKPTDKVAVIGIGGLGHLALKFLSAWGCEVTAFTSSGKKRKEALELGAHHTLSSRDATEIASAAGRFDLIISTVDVELDWALYLSTLCPKGRLHMVGAVLAPLGVNALPLMSGQKSISGSTVGSPATMKKMLEFCQRHDIKPMIETYKFGQINDAIARLRSGEARYRIVLERE